MDGQRFRIAHRTTYEYSLQMNDGYTLAFVVPRETPWQNVAAVTVDVDPEADERFERDDLFGNHVVQFGIHHQHDALTVTATSDVTVFERELDGDGPPWEDAAGAVRALRGERAIEVRPFAGGVPLVDGADAHLLRTVADPAFRPCRPVVDVARALCHDIHEQFEYDHEFTEVSTPLATVLAARRGVCQDFAHLAVSALRSFGLAARYVSGYIEAAPEAANASHAWCSVWVPRQGWVDFDPTNGQLPVRRHVTVAWGRDYGDVAPVRGVVIGPPATQQLTVAVDVEALAADGAPVSGGV